ncbi:MAG: hypothetical protein U0835_15515 [Isosphaeraceae bacterium]
MARLLRGGLGRNVLIGSGGADRIYGGGDDNILIGGTTDFDLNAAALDLVFAEWSQDTDFDQRVNNIRKGKGLLAGSGFFLDRTTVHDDLATDLLTAGAGQNWYFIDATTAPVVGQKGDDRVTRV